VPTGAPPGAEGKRSGPRIFNAEHINYPQSPVLSDFKKYNTNPNLKRIMTGIENQCGNY